MATGRIGVTPNLRTRWSKAPAGGTTSLSGLDDNSVSLVYDAGFEAVYRNGVLLSRGNDYTATNGTTITLIDATIAGDIIEVFANQAIPLTSTYTQAVADGKFINNTLVDAKGDILTATAADTPARLAVGTDGQYLQADSTASTGLKWATLSTGAYTELATGSLSGTEISLTSISASYRDLFLVINNPSTATASQDLSFRINGGTGSSYRYSGLLSNSASIVSTTSTAVTQMLPAAGNQQVPTNTTTYNSATLRIENYALSNLRKVYQMTYGASSNTIFTVGEYTSSSAVSSIQIRMNGTATFSGGTYTLYGVK